MGRCWSGDGRWFRCGGKGLGLLLTCGYSPFTSEIYAKRDRERRAGKKVE